MIQLVLIFIDDDILVSKKTHACWREIQAQYDRSRTSLGPWNEREIISWLDGEYSDLFPAAQQQIEQFLLSGEESRPLTFRAACK